MFSKLMKTPGLQVGTIQSFLVSIILLMSVSIPAIATECGVDFSSIDFSSEDAQAAVKNFADGDSTALENSSLCSLNGMEEGNCAASLNACQAEIVQAAERAKNQNPLLNAETSPEATQTLATNSTPEQAAVIMIGQASFDQLNQQKKACLGKYKTAQTACNPTKNDTMTQIGQTAAALLEGFAGSGLGACSKMGDLLKAATGALGAFRGQCAAFQQRCSSSCNDALEMAQEASTGLKHCTSTVLSNTVKAEFNSLPTGTTNFTDSQVQRAREGCQLAKKYFDTEVQVHTERAKQIAARPEDDPYPIDPDKESDLVTIKDAVNLCAAYQQTVQKAALNGLQMFQMGQVSKQCENAQDRSFDTALQDYCTQFPDAAECQDITKIDCTNPAIAASDPKCICEAKPDDPICGKLAAADQQGLGQEAGTASFSSSLSEDDFSPLGDGGPSGPAIPSVAQKGGQGLGAGGSVGAGGPSVGGGSGISGGGGGGDGQGGYAGSGIDENIILGRGGGGRGGGGGFQFSRRGDGNSKYGKYLPKVGAKAKADKKEEKKDITSPAGPSNFDKVSHRYRANRRTLLPE